MSIFESWQALTEARLEAGEEVRTRSYRNLSPEDTVGAAPYSVVRAIDWTGGTPNGYTEAQLPNGNYVFIHDSHRHLGVCWGIRGEPEVAGNPVENQTTRFNAFRDDAAARLYTARLPAGRIRLDKMDLKDKNLIGLLGEGAEKTKIYAAMDLDGPEDRFLDCGYTGTDFVTPDSSILYANIGGFSIRADGFNITWGATFNYFRRGQVDDIRLVDFQNAARYSYSWLNLFSRIRAVNYYVLGHKITSSSNNGVTMTGLTATTNRPGAVGYVSRGVTTVVLVSPDCEGTGNDIGFEIENGRSWTIINPHIESPGNIFKITETPNNGLNLKIIGGASFNCPESISLNVPFEQLIIDGFAMHSVGPDFSEVLIRVNAKTCIINMSVYDDARTPMTQEELIAAIEVGSNVERLVVNGEVVNIGQSASTYYDNLTPNPGNPVDIDMPEITAPASFEVFAQQRTSSTNVSCVKWIATVDESDVFADTELGNVKNGVTNMVLNYNPATKKLTMDAGTSPLIKINITEI